MADALTVGIIGCGRLGQHYAEVYQTFPDTQVIALAEINAERRQAVGERFGIDALFADAEEMLRHVTPDLSVVVLPGKYIKDAVIASAEAGVRGVSSDKPIGATLADVDAMVEACDSRGIIFAGGNLQRAMGEVQEAAAWIRSGEFGPLRGATVHGFGGEISGGGCQHIGVLRLFTGAEMSQIIAWGTPEEALQADTDEGLIIHAQATMSNGLPCSLFGTKTPLSGVDVWTDDALIRWDWGAPQIFQGVDANGARRQLDRPYTPLEHPRFTYLGTSVRSFVDAVRAGGGELYVSGHDLRQSLEVAIAAKVSAVRGNLPMSLPLEDRSLALLPRDYRWLGGDASGLPQTRDEAMTMELFPNR